MEPIFVLDVRDQATGKQVAVRVSREEALLPLAELTARALRTTPEDLVAAGRLASEQADTLYRIHGTNEPDTIGRSVSSGCIRMLNQDVMDLYARTPVGAKVIVLAADGATAMSATTASATRSPRPAGIRQPR